MSGSVSTRFSPSLEFALGADLTGNPSYFSWYDYTDRIHLASKVTRKWGRQNRQATIGPASLTFTLLNEGDDLWVPDNPLSDLYGLIDINTPVRLLMRPNENSYSDAFARSASSSWGSADSGGAWTNTGGAASDYSVSSTNGGRHQHGVVNTQHCSTLAASLRRIDIRVRIRVNQLSAGGPQRAGIICRYTDANNHRRAELQYAVGGAITARITYRTAGVDSVFASASTGLFHSTSTWVWLRLQTGGTSARVKVWQDGIEEPRGWLIDGQNGSMINPVDGAVGLYSLRETGNSNANAQFDFDDFSMADGPYIMQTCYIPAWPTEWTDASGNQSIAQVTAYGRLRSLQQGQKLKSFMNRLNTIIAASEPAPVAYWSLEDESGAASFASGVDGGRPAFYSNVRLAADSTFAGCDALPVVGESGTITGVVPTYTASSKWAIRFLIKVPAAPTGSTGLLAWATGGTIPVWEVVLNPANTFELRAYNAAGTNLLGATTANFTDGYGTSLYGRQVYVTVDAVQNGANIDWTCYITGADDDAAPKFVNGSVAGTIGGVLRWAHSAAPGLTAGGHTIGHVAVAADTAYNMRGGGQVSGNAGELADTRFLRVLSEEGITGYFGEILGAGVGTTTQRMGAQRTASLYQLLQETEKTEQGLLFDGRQGHPTLLPRSQRINHAVDLTLDVAQQHVVWPLARAVDDQLFVTEATASRAGGSTAVARDLDLIRRVGLRPETWPVNPASDAQLASVASWRLHLGTNRDARYPMIALDFGRNEDLIRDYLETDIGGRIQIVNPPGELPPETVDLLAEGGIDVIDPFSWRASVYASPASSWDAFTVEGSGNLGRAVSGGSVLGTAAAFAATSLSVATTRGRLWSSTAVPYDVMVSGERVTVTAVNSAIRDTFTRSTSNGWGSTDTSQTWVVGAGTASLFSATGSVGQIAVSALNTEHHIAVDVGYAPYQRVRAYQTLGVTPTGAGINWGVMLRRTDASNLFWVDVQVGTDSTLTLRIISKIAGANTQLASAVSATTHSTSVARILVAEIDAANTIRAKVYASNAAEPHGWEISYDASAVVGLSAGTSVGCIARLMTGNTNAAPVNFQFDNFVVLNPQTFTVTRSVNGVVKPLPAGAPVALQRPGVIAL